MTDAARLARSAAAVCLPPPPEDLLLECIRAAVAANAEYVPPTESGGFLYIRPVLFGASAGLPLVSPNRDPAPYHLLPSPPNPPQTPQTPPNPPHPPTPTSNRTTH